MKLTNLVLAGAMALGLAGCENGCEKKQEPCQVEFGNYKCETYALGQDRLPGFYKDGYNSELRVYKNDDLVIRYIPATKESCELNSECGNHFDSLLTDQHEIDMALELAQKCEQLLEQKYNQDF